MEAEAGAGEESFLPFLVFFSGDLASDLGVGLLGVASLVLRRLDFGGLGSLTGSGDDSSDDSAATGSSSVSASASSPAIWSGALPASTSLAASSSLGTG